MDWLSAAGTALNGILSFLGGTSANQQNVKLARETNAQNYQMWQENVALQKDLLNKQLSYQDPSNLRRLLENAGYNPASLVAGANGALGSSPSVNNPSPIPAQSPHVEDVITPAVAQAVQGISAMADAKNKLAEAKGKEIDNQNKQAHWDALINNMIQSGFLTKEQAESYSWQNLLTETQFDSLSKMASQQVYKLNADARLADVNARMQEYLLKHKAPKEVQEIDAKISNLMSQGKYYEAQSYATRAGVPATIASLLAQAHRDSTQAALNEAENEMNEPTKQMIGELTKGKDFGSNLMKLLFLWIRKGKP